MQNFLFFGRRGGRASRTCRAVLAALLLCLASTLPATAQQADELFDYPETTISGTSLAQIETTVEKCKALCASRSLCKGFNFSAKENNCRLLGSIMSAHADSSASAGTRDLLQNYKDPTNPPLAARLEKLRTTDTDGNELLELSREAFRKNDRAIGRQAIDLAIGLGNQDAKLEMARWYDPRTFDSNRVDAADANKAARSYWELYQEHNNPQAQELLRTICAESTTRGSTGAFQDFFGNFYCQGM